jgi:hypothetical protein
MHLILTKHKVIKVRQLTAYYTMALEADALILVRVITPMYIVPVEVPIVTVQGSYACYGGHR